MSEPVPNEVAIALLRVEVDHLRAEVKESADATRDLVQAWNAAARVVTFIKWASTLGAALGSLWMVIAHWFRWDR